MSTLTPPFTVPAGQTCLFLRPTTFGGIGIVNEGCLSFGSYILTGLATLTGGYCASTGGCSISTNKAFINWGGFKTDNLPFGTVIKAIYPLVAGSGNLAGLTVPLVNDGLSGAGAPFIVRGAFSGQYSSEFPSASMGDTYAAIEAAEVNWTWYDSAIEFGINTWIEVTFGGLAVYVVLPSNSNAPIAWIDIHNTKQRF